MSQGAYEKQPSLCIRLRTYIILGSVERSKLLLLVLTVVTLAPFQWALSPFLVDFLFDLRILLSFVSHNLLKQSQSPSK